MKKRLLPFILAGALTAAFAAPVAATNHTVNTCDLEQGGGGGPVALAALVAAALEANVGICNISVELLNNSLNNLLRNADIDVLNNSLNNILRNANIEVEVLNNSQIVVNLLSVGGVVIDSVTVNFV